MTLRVGWLSPLTPASGVGTFSHAVATCFPTCIGDEAIDLTLLYPDHPSLHYVHQRSIRIEDSDSFRNVLTLFDLLIYNIGNNTEHHETIFKLLRTHPGIIVCHDFVYQHYLAGRSMEAGRSFASYAALLMKFGDANAGPYLARSRITSRLGKIRYTPWDSDASSEQPMSEAILDLGSALVVHSNFSRKQAEKCFHGPILQLGMPHDQKQTQGEDTFEVWSQTVLTKNILDLVSFGHIQSTKCIDLVIEAIASSPILRKRVRYTIAGFVGDSDYLRSLEEMITAAKLGEIVRFETGVSDMRLLELMRDADVFVNLRRPNTEGASASLIEQLDSGRPVVVLDSGCYAEIPAQAAVKVPSDADADVIRAALERMAKNPARLPVIGGAGRSHARTWTCASYGRQLIEFALEHRDLLRRRGRIVGAGDRPNSAVEISDKAWVERLAQARGAMRYFDRNVLVVDPQLIMSFGTNELCSYVAHVIFGIFDDPRLLRTLSRFFASRDVRSRYWACAKFSLIVDAVFADEERARERLSISGPSFDPEFWDVLEALPPKQYVSAATLAILGRSPTPEELALAGDIETSDGCTKRQALLGVLQHVADHLDAGVAKLKRWLEQPSDQHIGSELAAIDHDFDCCVGSSEFRKHADLSGFFPQESDHAWTQGARGFVGVRLGDKVQRIEMMVRHVAADAEQPALIQFSSGPITAEIEVETTEPCLLAYDVPPRLAGSDATTWFQLTTSRAGRPNGSLDHRELGVCLLQIRIVTAPCDEPRPR